ncbi:hypothetical protein NPIL_670451 [Nephila pilipes]|uniref:Uncharacterized protein n=1 Tax=Nephila pilipes TaxID=299642 RepID=A0A8X6PEG1_NEPPI|nr:hypothetical protein NPIL_670451 [Nephila pilipes]
MTRINDIMTRINDIMTRINDIMTRNELVQLVLQATEFGTLASRPLCSPSDTEGIVQSKEKLNPAVYNRLLNCKPPKEGENREARIQGFNSEETENGCHLIKESIVLSPRAVDCLSICP